jgi:hypothetical protein
MQVVRWEDAGEWGACIACMRGVLGCGTGESWFCGCGFGGGRWWWWEIGSCEVRLDKTREEIMCGCGKWRLDIRSLEQEKNEFLCEMYC